jgi:hypothetical protein
LRQAARRGGAGTQRRRRSSEGWCPGQDSNLHDLWPGDFKSPASTRFATRAGPQSILAAGAAQERSRPLFHNKKIVVVMPAYNAAKTLERTWREIPLDLVDEVVVTDDASHDETVAEAQRLGLRTLVHPRNRGYGGNQKTCYTEALRLGADVVVMLHPDYQYTPTASLHDRPDHRRPLRRGAGLAGARRTRPRRRHAAVQVRGEPRADRGPEPALRREALRVPHRLPGLHPRGARGAAPARELRRLRLRQPDAGADPARRVRDRRGELPGRVLRGGVVDQLPPLGALRARIRETRRERMGLGRLEPKSSGAEPPGTCLLRDTTNGTPASDPAAEASHSAEGAPAPAASKRLVEGAHEETRLFELDLPAEAATCTTYLSSAGRNRTDRSKSARSRAMQDRRALVPEATVAMQHEAERPKRRRARRRAQSGSGSGSTEPSGFTRNAPRKS